MKQFSWMKQDNVYTPGDATDRLSADTVVIGAGHSGTCAIRSAAEHCVTEVDIDTFVKDWQLRTGNRSNYRLIRTYAEECGEHRF